MGVDDLRYVGAARASIFLFTFLGSFPLRSADDEFLVLAAQPVHGHPALDRRVQDGVVPLGHGGEQERGPVARAPPAERA